MPIGMSGALRHLRAEGYLKPIPLFGFDIRNPVERCPEALSIRPAGARIEVLLRFRSRQLFCQSKGDQVVD